MIDSVTPSDELKLSAVAHGLDFLAIVMFQVGTMSRQEIEQLGNLLAVLADYVHILDHQNRN